MFRKLMGLIGLVLGAIILMPIVLGESVFYDPNDAGVLAANLVGVLFVLFGIAMFFTKKKKK
jgi:hypothetical protein